MVVNIVVAVAIAVAVGSFVITDTLAQRRGWECDHPALFAFIAGIFWPVLVVGLVQFLAIAAFVKFAFQRRHRVPQNVLAAIRG